MPWLCAGVEHFMPVTAESTRDVATVERLIAAPAATIFDLLADPARHTEIDGSGTVRDVVKADAAQHRLALGDKFGMSMHMGIGYKMVNEVVEFEENRQIAWQPRPTIGLLRPLIGGRIWRYELTSQEGGTLVRESWDIRQEKVPFLVRPMRSATVDSMTKTLERLASVVEG